MKNLHKIPRISSAKFCWQSNNPSPHFLEKPREGVPYADNLESDRLNESQEMHNSLNSLTSDVKATPESTEYSDKKIIDSAINSAKNGEKLPENFKKIKASEFLKRSAEELKTLFIVDGIVDFRGNNSASDILGLANFFPKVSNDEQFVVLNGVPYAYGARRRDGKIGYGNPKYKVILGGEKIEYFIGAPITNEKTGKSRENIISFKNDKPENEVIPKTKPYSYAKLTEDFAENYENNELKNLTLDKAIAERAEFLERQKERDNREKLARQKEAELGLNENMNFKEKMTVIAKSIGESYKLPWEVIYAQAALESNYGKSGLTKRDNNYFGIKSSKDWDGPSSSIMKTQEDYGNGLEDIQARFRGYSSMFDSAIGYAKFINKYSRYQPARENYRTGGTPYMYLKGIKEAGYATDPFYVYKVNRVFKSNFGYDIPGKI